MKKKTNTLALEDLVACRCGRIWHLEKMKEQQYDWDLQSRVRCSCGVILWTDEDKD